MESDRKSVFPATDEYTDKEKQKLLEFRKIVGDSLESDDQKEDSYLIRWLRARNLDLVKAEEMFRASMKWRKDNNIDTILEQEEIPEEFSSSTPIAFCGISNDGYAVFVCPFGRHDARHGLEKYGIDRMERFQIHNMEKLSKLFQEEGKKHGKNVTQIIEILDCEGYSYKQFSSKLCRDFMAKIQPMMDNHYPEILRYAMLVNTPKVFAALFALMKPFIPKSTLEKIDIYGPDQDKWKAVVREKFPVEMIPRHWGGTCEGKDEYCSGHEMWLQGPKDMKAFMHGLSEEDSAFQKTMVNARDKFVKCIEVTEKNTILEWKFKSDNHDIALTLLPNNSNSSPKINNNHCQKNGKKDDPTLIIVPHSRVDSQNSLQEGSHVCEITGKYSFIFDNSYSMIKAKTLLYQIDVMVENSEEFEDCPEIPL